MPPPQARALLKERSRGLERPILNIATIETRAFWIWNCAIKFNRSQNVVPFRMAATWDAITAYCSEAWDKLVDPPWRIMPIGRYDWPMDPAQQKVGISGIHEVIIEYYR